MCACVCIRGVGYGDDNLAAVKLVRLNGQRQCWRLAAIARMDSIHSCVETTQNPQLEGSWNQRPHYGQWDVPQMFCTST